MRVAVIILSWLWKGFFCQEWLELYTINVSDDFPAQRGLCVLFPCTFTYDDRSGESPDNSRGFWYRDDESQPCGTRRPVACNHQCNAICAETKGRFRLVGDLLKRDCSLRIDDVRDSDRGDYFFRYENSPTSRIKWNYRNNYKVLHVEVQDLTDKPEVTLPDRIIEGQTVTVNCTPPGRCLGSPATIKWDVEFSSTYHEHIYLIEYPNATKFNVSSITFHASRQDHRKYLNCTAVFPAVGESTTRTSLLNIQYSMDRESIPTSQDSTNSTTSSPVTSPESIEPTSSILVSSTGCGLVNCTIIIGIVIGNLVVLFLIGAASFCFINKFRKKYKDGDTKKNKTVTEPTYQDVRHTSEDIYSNLEKN